ncbi:MAG: DUF4105 domain-containing protein [Trueperaceae bacterium]
MRPWKPDHARQASATIDGAVATVQNVRATRYPDPGEPYDVRWETRTYDLDGLKRLWFVVEPFVPRIPAIAHTFISFEFEDDFLAMSIEARQRVGQRYSVVKGQFGAYDLAYVFGDEQDLFLRRTLHQRHEVYLYPLVTPPLEVRSLFLTSLATANALVERPRRYDSLRANCTNTLRKHANQVRPGSFPPFVWADIMPGRSDKVLYRKGWIDTDAAERGLRAHHAIRDVANAIGPTPDFSRRIRER